MKKVYRITVDQGRRGVAETVVIAESPLVAEHKIQKRSASIIDIHVDFVKTADFILSRGGFPPRELAQVYINLGRRLSKGAKTTSALEQAESFVTSSVLKTALQDVRAAVAANMTLPEAMIDAGFSEEDCSLVTAMSGIGEAGRAFISLGNAWQRKASIQQKIHSMLFRPVSYSIIGLLMIWASFVFVIPIMSKKFVSMNLRLPAYVSGIYHFDAVISRHVLVFSVFYFSVFILIGYLLYASRTLKRMYRKAPYLSQILNRSDAAQALNTLSMLYSAASTTRPKIMERVSGSCQDEDMRLSFSQFGNAMETGLSQKEAVIQAAFPPFIAPTMIGAFSADDPIDTVDELRNSAELLAEDVEIYSKKFQEFMDLVFTIGIGVIVLGVFFIALFPQIGTLLNNI